MKPGESPNRKSVWTMLAFVFMVVFALHVMLIPVWYGLDSLNLFAADRTVVSPIPVWFIVSGLSALALSIASMLADSLLKRSRTRGGV